MVITPVIVIGLINYGNVTHHSEDGDFIDVVLFGWRFQLLFPSSPRNWKKTDCQWLSYCGVGLEHVGTTNQMFQFVKERSEMRCCGFFADACSFKNAVFRYRKGDVCGQCSFSQKVGIDSQITTSRNKSSLKFFVNGNRSKATDSILLGYLATRHLWYPMIMQGAGPYGSQKGSSGRIFTPDGHPWSSYIGSEVDPFFCAGGVNPCS